jgi:hypothetical protein
MVLIALGQGAYLGKKLVQPIGDAGWGDSNHLADYRDDQREDGRGGRLMRRS